MIKPHEQKYLEEEFILLMDPEGVESNMLGKAWWQVREAKRSHVIRTLETEQVSRRWGKAITSTHTPSDTVPATPYPTKSTTNQRSSFQTHELTGDISCSNRQHHALITQLLISKQPGSLKTLMTEKSVDHGI